MRLMEAVALFGCVLGTVEARDVQVEKKAPPATTAPAPGPAPAPAKPAAPLAPAAPAAKPAALDPEVKALVERMQRFYESTSDFTASFSQTYAYAGSRRQQTSAGTMTFKKPGLMRWEYATPSPKTFVLANDKVYMHDPEAKLLTRARIDTSQLSASVTFLFGKGNLLDEFDISRGACASCAGTLLELVPRKPDPRFKRLKLEVDPKSAQVIRSVVIDPDGSQNAITFSQMKANVGVSEKAFVLSPPEGTQMQDYMGGGKN